MGPHTAHEAGVLLQGPYPVVSIPWGHSLDDGTAGDKHHRTSDSHPRCGSAARVLLLPGALPYCLAAVQGVPGGHLHGAADHRGGQSGFRRTQAALYDDVCARHGSGLCEW